ncbi:MAG: hypothetical protein GOVbin4206_94 [Prokaryotic dsDNA virus sp.]|nr:MAG: hypothetical protein GOVbin4206_94 [Prokaryotic dsDNA virus sp.]|tara:strand:- start:640 stop:849 length:210 start_codon:yes stop_codon:yes gene_type:complete
MFGNLSQQFQKYLEIEKERNLQMLEISKLLRVDFTFSEGEMIANAEAKIAEYMERVMKDRLEEALKGME